MWGKGLHQNSRKHDDEQRLCQTCWPEAKSIIQGGSGEVVGPLLSHHRCEEVALVVWFLCDDPLSEGNKPFGQTLLWAMVLSGDAAAAGRLAAEMIGWRWSS